MALAQSHQTTVAQALTQSTVQGNGVETLLLQIIGQAIALNLGTGKKQSLD